jgi:hypothetical protein
LKYLPPRTGSLPQEILDMVDMDKFRLQEQQNGSIVLNPGDTEIKNLSSDGHKDSKPEKKELEVIVAELNERFHFNFEDRDKVMRIVIPKLTRDQSLVAAFQTDNLETLRKQKFAESLENAFIASASDFYSVLNRMSVEPDFRRLLTEFALGEFKRELGSANAGLDPPEQLKAFDLLAKRATAYISQQLGADLKWSAINSAVWSAIRQRADHAISLTEIDEMAKIASVESDEVLAVLALLSRPASGLLEMRYFTDEHDGAATVSKEEVASHLTSWWKKREIDDDAWRAWAGKVIVRWAPRSQARFLNDSGPE